MAVILRSDTAYQGAIADLPPVTAPMPGDAALYGDFVQDLYITQAYRGADYSKVLDTAGVRRRYLRNAAGDVFLAAAASPRPSYDASGRRNGFLVEGENQNHLALAQRADPSQAEAQGVTFAKAGAAAEAFNQWWDVTGTGTTGHNLVFGTEVSISSGNMMCFALEVQHVNHRYVQLSSGAAEDATDYANFDLVERKVTATGAGVSSAYIVPTLKGMTLVVQYYDTIAGTERPTLSLVSSGTVAKQPANTAATTTVRIRLAKLRYLPTSGAQAAPLSPLPTTGTTEPDQIIPLATLVPTTGNWAFLMQGTTSPWINKLGATIFTAGASASAGLMIRFEGASLGLYSVAGGVNTLVHDFGVAYAPGMPLTVAVAREGNIFRAAVAGGKDYEGDLTAALANAAPRPFGNHFATTRAWDGFMTRLIGWNAARSRAQLLALVQDYA